MGRRFESRNPPENSWYGIGRRKPIIKTPASKKNADQQRRDLVLLSTDGLASVKVAVDTGVKLVQQVTLVGTGSVGGGTSARGGREVGVAAVVHVGVDSRVKLVGSVRAVRSGILGVSASGTGGVSAVSAVGAVGAVGTVSTRADASGAMGAVGSTVVTVAVNPRVELVGDLGVVRTSIG